MKKLLVFFLVITALMVSSCAKIYSTPDAVLIAKTHKLIAIVPPTVAIAAKKGIDVNVLVAQQKTESVNFQREMISWLLKRKMQGRISSRINVLDLEATNIKLQRAGFSETHPFTPDEMCEALGVDAVITSNFALTKPMSELGAIALAVLFRVGGVTNETTANLSIFDKETKKMIWNYQHTLSGGLLSSPATLIDALMRQSSRKMPYYTDSNSKIPR
jgi:hypothetical protein